MTFTRQDLEPVVDREDLRRLTILQDRLYSERRMTADDMRDAAQTLERTIVNIQFELDELADLHLSLIDEVRRDTVDALVNVRSLTDDTDDDPPTL